MVTLPFSETVTLHVRSAGAPDRYGNVTDAFHDTVVPGCAVWPTGSSQSPRGEATGGGDVVTDSVTLMPPGGVAFDSLDEVTVRGLRYRVDGDSANFHSPLTGLEVTQVRLVRVT